jgi:DNA repair protein RecO (recombination protein O)
MKIKDKGIFLHGRILGNSNLLTTFFTENNGLFTGLIKNGATKKKRAVYQTGNIFELNWSARLEEHLGLFTPKLEKGQSFELISTPQKLNIINSISFTLKNILAEKEVHQGLYYHTLSLIEKITDKKLTLLSKEETYRLTLKNYINWEIAFLAEIGFGLDFEKCNATGTTENLKYLSPKTGKAICEDAGKQFEDKLFLIPDFILNKTEPSTEELKDLFNINNFYLRKNALRYCDEEKTQKLLTLREKNLNK